MDFDGSFPVLLASFFAKPDGLLLEFDGMVGLGNADSDENELYSSPDEENPECPPVQD